MAVASAGSRTNQLVDLRSGHGHPGKLAAAAVNAGAAADLRLAVVVHRARRTGVIAAAGAEEERQGDAREASEDTNGPGSRRHPARG